MPDSAGPSRPPASAPAPVAAGPGGRAPSAPTPPRFASPKEQEAYYANLAKSPLGPPSPRFMRLFTVFSWGLGAFTVGYMVLFADFGKQEHVFSPVRREFAKYTRGWTTLSESERDMLGLNKEAAAPATQKQA